MLHNISPLQILGAVSGFIFAAGMAVGWMGGILQERMAWNSLIARGVLPRPSRKPRG